MNFGQVKRLVIKSKVLCDLKKNSGLQLPKLRICFEAVGFAGIQEWIKLENNRLLKLEGNNLIYGWHAYYIRRRNMAIFLNTI